MIFKIALMIFQMQKKMNQLIVHQETAIDKRKGKHTLKNLNHQIIFKHKVTNPMCLMMY